MLGLLAEVCSTERTFDLFVEPLGDAFLVEKVFSIVSLVAIEDLQCFTWRKVLKTNSTNSISVIKLIHGILILACRPQFIFIVTGEDMILNMVADIFSDMPF